MTQKQNTLKAGSAARSLIPAVLHLRQPFRSTQLNKTTSTVGIYCMPVRTHHLIGLLHSTLMEAACNHGNILIWAAVILLLTSGCNKPSNRVTKLERWLPLMWFGRSLAASINSNTCVGCFRLASSKLAEVACTLLTGRHPVWAALILSQQSCINNHMLDSAQLGMSCIILISQRHVQCHNLRRASGSICMVSKSLPLDCRCSQLGASQRLTHSSCPVALRPSLCTWLHCSPWGTPLQPLGHPTAAPRAPNWLAHPLHLVCRWTAVTTPAMHRLSLCSFLADWSEVHKDGLKDRPAACGHMTWPSRQAHAGAGHCTHCGQDSAEWLSNAHSAHWHKRQALSNPLCCWWIYTILLLLHARADVNSCWQALTFIIESAASKVNKHDRHLAPLLSHHYVLGFQVPVTPVLVQISQNLHNVLPLVKTSSAHFPTVPWAWGIAVQGSSGVTHVMSMAPYIIQQTTYMQGKHIKCWRLARQQPTCAKPWATCLV